MDTKKFTIMVAILTAFVCVITITYNFASFPAYNDDDASLIPIYKDKELEVLQNNSEKTNDTKDQDSSVKDTVNQESPDEESSNNQTTKQQDTDNNVKSSKVQSSSKNTGSSKTKDKSIRENSGQSSSSKADSSKSVSSKVSSELALSSVNLNTATLEELQRVPYVGEVHAKAIIDYRIANGSFKTIDELDNVKGFGKATIDKIRKYLTV